jgi:branched-chain amino acid transport system permease protein
VRSPFGRALQAIRENERRFASLGRDSRPFKIVVFVIAATLAGLAGALFAPFRGFASPEIMFWVLSGQALMMVITGGIGTLIGPIVGAMIFLLIQEVLSSYTEHWMIFTGGVFVLMVIFLPGGVVGTLRRWFPALTATPETVPVRGLEAAE